MNNQTNHFGKKRQINLSVFEKRENAMVQNIKQKCRAYARHFFVFIEIFIRSADRNHHCRRRY